MPINVPLGDIGTFQLAFTSNGSSAAPPTGGSIVMDTNAHGVATLAADGKTVTFATRGLTYAPTTGTTNLTYSAPGGVMATEVVNVVAATITATFNEASLVLT